VLALEWFRMGELRKASALVQESLRLERSVHDLIPTAQSMEVLAWIAEAEGRAERAAHILGAAQSHWRSLGRSMPTLPPLGDLHRACSSRLRARLGDDGFAAAFLEGAELSFDQAIAYALDEDDNRAAARPPPQVGDSPPLTDRERQVAELVARGLTTRRSRPSW
jgi:hypothetical protein